MQRAFPRYNSAQGWLCDRRGEKDVRRTCFAKCGEWWMVDNESSAQEIEGCAGSSKLLLQPRWLGVPLNQLIIPVDYYFESMQEDNAHTMFRLSRKESAMGW